MRICTSTRIKEMFESYGSGLLDSVKFDGKLMAIPETVIRSWSASDVAAQRLDG